MSPSRTLVALGATAALVAPTPAALADAPAAPDAVEAAPAASVAPTDAPLAPPALVAAPAPVTLTPLGIDTAVAQMRVHSRRVANARAERRARAHARAARAHARARAEARHRARARARRAAANAGPTGALAAIAQCESGGNPRAVGGGGAYRGLYQFSYATWAAVGGSGDPAAASVGEQTRRAQLLYDQAGPSQWPVCGQ